MTSNNSHGNHAWAAAMPGLFVVLWSTGFIGAKLGLPYAEPYTFLLWRFSILVVILAPAAWVMKAPWPKSMGDAGRIAISGVLMHGGYLGGVFTAIKLGMPAGLVALIVGLQPLLTAIASGPLLGEKVTARQWVGLFLGLIGVSLVLGEKMMSQGASATLFDGFGPLAIGFSLLALCGITFGTVYQKRYCTGMDLRSGSAIQFGAAALVMAVVAPFTEDMTVIWSGEFIFAMGWLVFVLSIGAMSLLWILIKLGEAARVASLFYLVPPVTALIAYFLFDEYLGLMALVGMAIAMGGVALVLRR